MLRHTQKTLESSGQQVCNVIFNLKLIQITLSTGDEDPSNDETGEDRLPEYDTDDELDRTQEFQILDDELELPFMAPASNVIKYTKF